MTRFIALLLFAVAFLVAGPGVASADVQCAGPPAPLPPSSAYHCIYAGNDASSTYLHLGNAESFFGGNVAFNGAGGSTGTTWNNWVRNGPSGPLYHVGRTSYTRYSKTSVGVNVNIYSYATRRYCFWAGAVSGPDTNPNIGYAVLQSCSTY